MEPDLAAKLAIILTATENKNTIPHARRLAGKYGFDIEPLALEAAAAALAADALRQLAAVKGGAR
jgi:hypothetical protein